MKIYIICILIFIISCAPTVQTTKNKNAEIKIGLETQPELNIDKLNNVLVLLDSNSPTQNLFYEAFTSSNHISSLNYKINFIYSVEDIEEDFISNTIIVGPTSSDDLLKLKSKLAKNNLILSLTNDLTLKKDFLSNQIIFLGMSPFQHILKLKDTLNSSKKIGILYKQNFYGVRLNNFLKQNYKDKLVKSSAYTDRPEDINFAIQDLGQLSFYDNIILIDDSYTYKDVLANLSSAKGVYPYDQTYLIDNFLEERKTISKFYSQIKRAYVLNFDLESSEGDHREFFFKTSVDLALGILSSIEVNNKMEKIFLSKDFGYLEVQDNFINYPIIFK